MVRGGFRRFRSHFRRFQKIFSGFQVISGNLRDVLRAFGITYGFTGHNRVFKIRSRGLSEALKGVSVNFQIIPEALQGVSWVLKRASGEL